MKKKKEERRRGGIYTNSENPFVEIKFVNPPERSPRSIGLTAALTEGSHRLSDRITDGFENTFGCEIPGHNFTRPPPPSASHTSLLCARRSRSSTEPVPGGKSLIGKEVEGRNSNVVLGFTADFPDKEFKFRLVLQRVCATVSSLVAWHSAEQSRQAGAAWTARALRTR